MKAKVLISVFGDDKPGLVKQISDTVKKHGGNWLESRLSHLGGKFAGLVLSEFDQQQMASVIEALNQLSSDSLKIEAEATETQPTGECLTVQVLGNDKPGIIYEIAGALNDLSVNVESLNSEVVAAPMSGGELFKATLTLSLPQGITFNDLQQKLETIANDLMVDLGIDQ